MSEGYIKLDDEWLPVTGAVRFTITQGTPCYIDALEPHDIVYEQDINITMSPTSRDFMRYLDLLGAAPLPPTASFRLVRRTVRLRRRLRWARALAARPRGRPIVRRLGAQWHTVEITMPRVKFAGLHKED